MLVNVHHDSPAEHRKLLVSGVAFLTAIALLIGLSIAIYQKAFADVAMVTIKADRAGLQLAKFGDVRVNGALVGQVREVSQDGEQASIRVALEPAAAAEIPANVEVQILPTTLFGQKFISFVDPDAPAAASLEDGSVIPAERVETNVELSRILANLFPLLRSVRPADLNATLNALATALGGRGEKLGQSLDKLDSYLTAIEGDLPTLRQNLVLLADVADTYDIAAPDLIGVLDNVTTTSKTVLEKKQELDTFFSDLTGLARTSTRILSENDTNLIRVGEVTEPVLRLLSMYSPEYPCLIKGMARYRPRLANVFRGQHDPPVLRLQHAPVPRVRPAGPSRVRRGRSRSVVPGPAEAPRADPAATTRRRHQPRRQPASEHDAEPGGSRLHLERVRRHGGRSGHHQRDAGRQVRSARRQLRRPRLADVRPGRPRGR